MARVAGVDLPPQKRSQIGLTYIYGIGKSRATSILKEAQVDINKKIRDLTEEELSQAQIALENLGYERESILMALGAPPSPVEYYHFSFRP